MTISHTFLSPNQTHSTCYETLNWTASTNKIVVTYSIYTTNLMQRVRKIYGHKLTQRGCALMHDRIRPRSGRRTISGPKGCSASINEYSLYLFRSWNEMLLSVREVFFPVCQWREPEHRLLLTESDLMMTTIRPSSVRWILAQSGWKILFWLNWCERKQLFRLKKQAE